MKRLGLLCLTFFFSTSALASDQNLGEFYSKINVNGQLSDEGSGSFSEIRSNNSWIGVKGNYQLDQGPRIVYRLEWKMDITAESGQSAFTERPQYVGVGGRYGEITLGRNFTALWMAQGKADLYNHYEGDIAAIWKGENRLSDVATYTTPTWNNFKGIVTYQAEKESGGDSAVSMSLFYGDQSLKRSNWFAALAHDDDIKGFDVTRFTVHRKVGDRHQLSFMVQQQEPSTGVGESDTGAFVSYLHKGATLHYRLQAQTMDDDTNVSVGVDYPFSDKTKFFAWVNQIEVENKPTRRYLALGFEHKISVKF